MFLMDVISSLDLPLPPTPTGDPRLQGGNYNYGTVTDSDWGIAALLIGPAGALGWAIHNYDLQENYLYADPATNWYYPLQQGAAARFATRFRKSSDPYMQYRNPSGTLFSSADSENAWTALSGGAPNSLNLWSLGGGTYTVEIREISNPAYVVQWVLTVF